MHERHVKESPILGLMGLGGGIASRIVGGILPFFASGGTTGTITAGDGNQYNYHYFTSSGALTISTTDASYTNFRIVSVGGGGGGGGNCGGDGGGSGGSGRLGYFLDSGNFTVAGNMPVTVGGGSPQPGSCQPGSTGGSSILKNVNNSSIITTPGGYGGASGGPRAGGAGGSVSSVAPNVTISWEYSAGGGQGDQRPDEGGGGGAGPAGTAYGSPNYNPSFIFYSHVSSTLQSQGKGGGGQGAKSGDPDQRPGSAGTPGGLIIYYPTDYI